MASRSVKPSLTGVKPRGAPLAPSASRSGLVAARAIQEIASSTSLSSVTLASALDEIKTNQECSHMSVQIVLGVTYERNDSSSSVYVGYRN